MRVCVVASHSGGHILPAVAFCQGLKDRAPDVEIYFITTEGEVERKILGNDFNTIFFKKKKITLLTAYNLAVLLFQAQGLFNKLRPDLVVGFGGYLSIPFIICAKLRQVPSLIHEQNVRLGLANRFLLRITDKIIFSFPNSRIDAKIKNKAMVLGLPLRKEIKKIGKKEAREFFGLDPECFTLLVIGGSQGSHTINTKMMQVLKDRGMSDVQVIHLAGSFKYDDLVEEYRDSNIRYKLFNFLGRMDCAFSAADLVISRAGANTIAEIVAMQAPSILIPYPYAKLHQSDNARFLSDRGAAILIEDRLLDKGVLKEAILSLKDDPQRLINISKALSMIKTPDARGRMAELALEMCRAHN